MEYDVNKVDQHNMSGESMITNHAKDRNGQKQMEVVSIQSERVRPKKLIPCALLPTYSFSVGSGYFLSHCSFVSFSACLFKKLVIFVLISLFLVRAENDMDRLSRAHLEGSYLWLLAVNNDHCARVQAQGHPEAVFLTTGENSLWSCPLERTNLLG